MSELLYNKSKAVEELNKVEGFYPLELARVISNEGQEEQRYLDVKYRKLWFRLVNPTGKIISRIVHFTENMAVVEARIYLDKCDQENNYIANSFSQKFRTTDTQFGDKFLEMAETAAIGRALADAGYGLQFADVGEGNDPMQVDAGIPVNQGTSMQAAMPAQNPAPAMQQTPNQPAGAMPAFQTQAMPGQQMMEQFYQEAQANGNTISRATGSGQMTNPVMSSASLMRGSTMRESVTDVRIILECLQEAYQMEGDMVRSGKNIHATMIYPFVRMLQEKCRDLTEEQIHKTLWKEYEISGADRMFVERASKILEPYEGESEDEK